MNLYGFAGGDPVNFSDPFGLDPCKGSTAWTECLAQAVSDWGAAHGGAAGSIALNGGAALNAGFEAFGSNGAASTGDALANGRVAEGALGAAFLAIPGGAGEGAAGKNALSALMRDATENPGNWKSVGAFAEQAINRKAKGGVSVQRIIENQAGDRLVQHTVIDRLGNVIDDHFRAIFKP